VANKNWLKKVDVFDLKFGLNTSNLFDQFSLLFWGQREYFNILNNLNL
jgi:hypothetical protein